MKVVSVRSSRFIEKGLVGNCAQNKWKGRGGRIFAPARFFVSISSIYTNRKEQAESLITIVSFFLRTGAGEPLLSSHVDLLRFVRWFGLLARKPASQLDCWSLSIANRDLTTKAHWSRKVQAASGLNREMERFVLFEFARLHSIWSPI